MKRYCVLYLPYSTYHRTWAKYGLKTEEEADNVLYSHCCPDCQRDMDEGHSSACECEMMIDEYSIFLVDHKLLWYNLQTPFISLYYYLKRKLSSEAF